MRKYNVVDLFAGAGGLMEGFLQSNKYKHLASVEWEKAPVETLRNRLETKWGLDGVNESVIWYDIQRTKQLFEGFEDEKYGNSIGLDAVVEDKTDLIIGGPPCQSYSVAGRVRDRDGMKYDYRNYLFEYYLKIVDRYRPKIFVFENVPGILSAMPDGTPIVDLIRKDVESIGYEITDDIKGLAQIDMSEYYVPQNRKRVIIIGLRKDLFPHEEIQRLLKRFYQETLPSFKSQKKITVKEAIEDLPRFYPLERETFKKGYGKLSHTYDEDELYPNHQPRYHNQRDIQIFGMLAEDIASGRNEYIHQDKINEIYNKATGGNSKVFKYHVLRPDKPSTTILAHLYKDGLRFIHYDPKQKRSISVREAARLQSFPDDFIFTSARGNNYKMIGNAVPPEFSRRLAMALYELLTEINAKI